MQNTTYPTRDPHREPVQIADQITVHGFNGSLFDLTFCTLVRTNTDDGSVKTEALVAARLRFDLQLARALVERLSQQIAMVESQTSIKN